MNIYNMAPLRGSVLASSRWLDGLKLKRPGSGWNQGDLIDDAFC